MLNLYLLFKGPHCTRGPISSYPPFTNNAPRLLWQSSAISGVPVKLFEIEWALGEAEVGEEALHTPITLPKAQPDSAR